MWKVARSYEKRVKDSLKNYFSKAGAVTHSYNHRYSKGGLLDLKISRQDWKT
jgi:hypothetical protein